MLKKSVVRTLLVMSFASTSFAQSTTPVAQPLVPVVAFFQSSEFQEAQLSPSGRYLAITTSKLGGRRALFVFDLSPNGKPTQAARIHDLDVVDVHWVNEDRLLFSVRDLSLGSGSSYHNPPGLFAVDRDGNNLLKLIRREQNAASGGRIRDRSLSPFHRLLAVPDFVAGAANDTIVVGEARFNAQWEVVSMRPLQVNVNNGLVQTFGDLKAPSRVAQWLFDGKGQPRVAISVDEMQGRMFYRAPDSETWMQIGEGNLLDMPFRPEFVDDRGTLYVTKRQGPAETSALTRFDFKTGAPEAKPLIVTAGFDFEGQAISSDQGLLGFRVTTDAEETVWLNAGIKAFQQKVDKLLPGRINRIMCRRCGSPDMVALVQSYSDREPGQVLVYRAKDDAWQSVGRVMLGIDPARMPRVDLQRIKARDGLELPVWITLPPGLKPNAKPEKPLLTVVLVHGGPNVRGRVWGWSPYAAFIASRGYLVIEPEFRGSDGFGRKFMEAGFKQWGQAMQDDVADTLLWAQKSGLASDRACIAGASYGGYATFAGLMRHPELYRCGVAWVAVTDLMLLAQGSSWVETDVNALSRQHVLSARLGDPEKDAAMLRANSPVEQAARIKAPVLLGMGGADLRVPLQHGERMRDALAKVGNAPEWVVYSDEGHSWLRPESRIDFANRMERFLAKHLGQP
ncbi:MAG: prolyl oligopeptidase family serine peptidase [Roseateles sp.]|uniref:alpha/beta hydrolase family protein n=1 Tax=Roseateles sp. TaxID=1971397 RepID=UPI0039E80B87